MNLQLVDQENDLNYLYCNEISRFHITIIRKYGHYWLLIKIHQMEQE